MLKERKNFLGLSSITEGLLSLIGILANHPEVQTRMQREIDHVLGEAEPRLEHRDKLHYVNAVCLYSAIVFSILFRVHVEKDL